MIGVAADTAHARAVTEFFELFKTPWEWLVPGKRYQVVLSGDGRTEPRDAQFALVYGAGEHPVDRRLRASVGMMDGRVSAAWADSIVPVYNGAAVFPEAIDGGILAAEGAALDYRATLDGVRLRRIGYDLFSEIELLLTHGQPRFNAAIPTVELHIALIRQCLDEWATPYMEVPPRPTDATFVCCLTHDVDFFGIRRHAADRTLAGFTVRGTVGTALDVVRRRRPVDEAIRNWLAVLSLPLIFAGLRRDLWEPFRDYAEADRGHSSTFFLVPFRNQPGVSPDGTIEPRRAVAYGIEDIKAEVQSVAIPRTEFAVHGIDAWRDPSAGRAEIQELATVTQQTRAGVRMHWLYFSDDAPRHLEDAGFDYDSTWGYNDEVGFRAGTLQAFRPPATEHLLELPLAIMDSALFYPNRMGLSREEAGERCSAIVQAAGRFGGALVINWHDRSLAPERQWGRCYERLLNEIEASGAWFATAGQAADWFRWRRSVRLTEDGSSHQITVEGPQVPDGLPPARLVMHRGHARIEEKSFEGGMCSLTL